MTRRGALVLVVTLLTSACLVVALILSSAGVAADSRDLCGEHFEADASFSGIGLPLLNGNGLALELRYTVTFRSKEQPDFVQVVQDSRFLGEIPEGGLEDWSLFCDLDALDPSYRLALLSYLADGGNRGIMLVSTLDEDAWPGAWWSEAGAARDRALDLGRAGGFAPHEMVWVQYWSETEDDGELLGYDSSPPRMVVLHAGKP